MYFNLDSIATFGDLFKISDFRTLISSSHESSETRASGFLKRITSKPNALLLPSGRSAVYLICKYLMQKNSDANIIVPGYTCSVVASAALSTGIKVRYCDIEDDGFCLDKNKLELLIDANTEAVLVQHIFGHTENIDQIRSIVKRALIIEDCAHSFGFNYNGGAHRTGTKGDAGFFSFDHTKAITCLGGGCFFTDNPDLAKFAQQTVLRLKSTSLINELVQILQYFIIFQFNTNSRSVLDKIMYKVLIRIFCIRPTMSEEEKNAQFDFFAQNPMGRAKIGILLSQFVRMRQLNQQRKKNFEIYNTAYKFYRADIKVALRYAFPMNKELGRATKRYFSGRWFNSPLHPVEYNNLEKFGYELGTCPNAEKMSASIINLPTGARIDANEILKIVEKS